MIPFGLMILGVGYVGLVFLITRTITHQMIAGFDREIQAARDRHQSFLHRKESLEDEKARLAAKAQEVFTMFEMIKDITKNFNETEAFEVFKKRLSEHMSYHQCFLMDPLATELDVFKNDQNFIFPIKDRREVLGVLVVIGAERGNLDKLAILGHQLSLGLRRIRLYQDIERMSRVDDLTEVHSRHFILDYFHNEHHRAQAKGMPISLLMIDVDHFKHFNDQYGHLTGDIVLREIAGMIKNGVREIDVVGRYGGEEFCVVLPDTEQEGALFVAERIRCMVEQSIIKAFDVTVKATVSIGAATYPQNGQNPKELLDKADWALYRAKNTGRNRVCAFGLHKG
jgi:diguanylate cyclase (GGDEF)-like protein